MCAGSPYSNPRPLPVPPAPGNFSLADAMLRWGASLNPPGGNSAGFPWLGMLAGLAGCQPSFRGWRSLVGRLVAAGASAAADLPGIRPPLVWLARVMGRWGCRLPAHLELLEIFLEHGADASALDAEGLTPLFYLVLGLPVAPAGEGPGWHRAHPVNAEVRACLPYLPVRQAWPFYSPQGPAAAVLLQLCSPGRAVLWQRPDMQLRVLHALHAGIPAGCGWPGGCRLRHQPLSRREHCLGRAPSGGPG